MTVELQALIGVWALMFLLIGFQGLATPFAHGFAYGLGARDEAKPRSVLAGRMDRTVANQMESVALFTPLILAAFMLDAWSPLTAYGALIYLGARVAFAALYIAGVPIFRSVAWGAGTVGLAMILAPVVGAAF